MAKLDTLKKKFEKAIADRDASAAEIERLNAEIAAAKAENKGYAKTQKQLDKATAKNNKAAEAAEKLQAEIDAIPEATAPRTSEKPCNVEAYKPITLGGSRAQIAQGFLDGKSFKDLADETNTSVGNIRTHLQNMVNFNGIGYRLEDGKVQLLIPEGAELFVAKPEPAPKKEKKSEGEATPAADDSAPAAE